MDIAKQEDIIYVNGKPVSKVYGAVVSVSSIPIPVKEAISYPVEYIFEGFVSSLKSGS